MKSWPFDLPLGFLQLSTEADAPRCRGLPGFGVFEDFWIWKVF